MAASRSKSWLPVILVVLTATLGPWLMRRPSTQKILTVYCAHDSVFADAILRDFERETGIQIDVRYDEEANKSLGLTNLLLTEKASPRCDVFWNNQAHGTIRLAEAGVLDECPAELFERFPEAFRDPNNRWCGFGGRLRVYAVNVQKMAADENALVERLNAEDLSRVAIAVPLFGTTLTNYSVLAETMGLNELKAWHNSIHQRGIREVRGNGAVKDLVAAGACDFGLTDTDDAFAAMDAGKPVEMLPVRTPDRRTICIPNTVALIKGAKHPEEAKRFIRYLLSETTERKLAESSSRQVPLGKLSDAGREAIPKQVLPLMQWAAESVPVSAGAAEDAAVLEWLIELYKGREQ